MGGWEFEKVARAASSHALDFCLEIEKRLAETVGMAPEEQVKGALGLMVGCKIMARFIEEAMAKGSPFTPTALFIMEGRMYQVIPELSRQRSETAAVVNCPGIGRA
jgi:hypothetical protein